MVSSADPVVSSRSFSSGKRGVRSSNRGRFRASSGASPLHGVDADERRELLVRRRRATRALDEVTPAHGESPRLADRDVDVLRAREVPVGPKEAVTLVAQVEQAADGDQLAGVLGFLSTSLELALSATTAVPGVRSRPRRRRPRRLPGSLALRQPCCMCWRFWFWSGHRRAGGRRRALGPPTGRRPSRSVDGLAAGGVVEDWSVRRCRGFTGVSGRCHRRPGIYLRTDGGRGGGRRTTGTSSCRWRSGARVRTHWLPPPSSSIVLGVAVGVGGAPAAARPGPCGRRRSRRWRWPRTLRHPAARRIWSMMSAFLLRELVSSDIAWAMARSSSRSFRSSTDRSSCCSAVISHLARLRPRFRLGEPGRQGTRNRG